MNPRRHTDGMMDRYAAHRAATKWKRGRAWRALADLCRSIGSSSAVIRWSLGLLLAYVLITGLTFGMIAPLWFMDAAPVAKRICEVFWCG